MKMAHPIEWIPKYGNHPEESAGSEYTASPGDFSRGRGDFWQRRSGFTLQPYSPGHPG
jgi:hypothetical protein